MINKNPVKRYEKDISDLLIIDKRYYCKIIGSAYVGSKKKVKKMLTIASNMNLPPYSKTAGLTLG